MKTYLAIVLVLIVFCPQLMAQETFNKEIKIMGHINSTGPIVLYNDTLICLGSGVDHDEFDYYAVFFAKLDLDGNLISRKIDIEPQRLNSYPWGNNDAYVMGDTLISSIDVSNSPLSDSYILLYDLKSGEILKKIGFKSQTSSQIVDFAKINDSTFAALSMILETQNSKFLNSQITIINIKTGEKKYILFGTQNKNDIPCFIHWTGRKFLIGSHLSQITVPNDLGIYQKFVIEGILYEVDSTGGNEIVFRTDTMRGPIKQIFETAEGDYICTSNHISFYRKPFQHDKYFAISHLIAFKLDKDLQTIWEKPIGFNFEKENDPGRICRILNSSQNDGYVFAGYQPNFPYNLSDEEIDSFWNNGIALTMVGMLEKLNENGDRIWLRTYSFENDPKLYPDNRIYDMIYSKDGGYYLYGEAYYAKRPQDTIWNNPAWLLKVDQYGCLVPGCQNGDTVNVTEESSQNELLIYPNPSSDVLYIYDDQGGESKYTITDIKGNIIRKWSGNLKDHTYIVQLHDFSPGVYIVSRIDEKGRVRSGKFVKGGR